jgi:hypothetical protein
MIIIGLILLAIGFIAHVAVLWSIGVVVLAIGLVVVLASKLGHTIGGRLHLFWVEGRGRIVLHARGVGIARALIIGWPELEC